MMDPYSNEKKLTDLLDSILKKAKAAGADHAEASASVGDQFTRSHRNREVETHERGESKGITLRVFVGDRPAVVSSNRWDDDSVTALVQRSVAIARSVPRDAEALPALEASIKSGPHDDYDSYDHSPASEEALIKDITVLEESALAVEGIRTLDSASATSSRGISGLMLSNGFMACMPYSQTSYFVDAMAQDGDDRQVAWDYDAKTHYADLRSPEEIGRRAGQKAVNKLSGRKLSSQRMPIIFDREISGSLLREFASAINGFSVSRGLSFMKDSMGETIFNPSVTIEDDPHRVRGPGSRSFDAEGLETRKLCLIKDGILHHWLLDLRSSRRLGLSGQGNAGGSLSRQPSPSTSNLYMLPGDMSPDTLYSQFDQALLVQEYMGLGGNTLTGDYSIGVSGVLLERGEKTYPVQEITIGGTLSEIFKACVPANDLEFRGATNAPTLYIGTMAVGGKTNA